MTRNSSRFRTHPTWTLRWKPNRYECRSGGFTRPKRNVDHLSVDLRRLVTSFTYTTYPNPRSYSMFLGYSGSPSLDRSTGRRCSSDLFGVFVLSSDVDSLRECVCRHSLTFSPDTSPHPPVTSDPRLRGPLVTLRFNLLFVKVRHGRRGYTTEFRGCRLGKRYLSHRVGSNDNRDTLLSSI